MSGLEQMMGQEMQSSGEMSPSHIKHALTQLGQCEGLAVLDINVLWSTLKIKSERVYNEEL